MAKRPILSLSIIIGLVLMFSACKEDALEQIKPDFWKGNTFHQPTVDTGKYDQGIIKVKTFGKKHKWEEYQIMELPDEFIKWNFGSRIKSLEKIKEKKFPSLAGPHNAIVATQGIRRFDTSFTINNAVKGMGFLPKKDKLHEIDNLLKSTINNTRKEKLDILLGLYEKAEELYDRTKQVSLELYSTPEHETHSFLNQMVNPRAAIVFLDIPCYELKVISQLLHPEDPDLTQYEKDMIEYTNLIHTYFHGEFEKQFITVVYHIIEVYNNSPSKNARGVRIMPEKK